MRILDGTAFFPLDPGAVGKQLRARFDALVRAQQPQMEALFTQEQEKQPKRDQETWTVAPGAPGCVMWLPRLLHYQQGEHLQFAFVRTETRRYRAHLDDGCSAIRRTGQACDPIPERGPVFQVTVETGATYEVDASGTLVDIAEAVPHAKTEAR